MTPRWLDATALAELMARKELDPQELLETTIARIEAENPKLNAVVHKTYEEARARLKQGVTGPLAGVPFLLKDLLATLEGTPQTAGSQFLAGVPSPHDSELVKRYKKAGLLILGKTNVPEFGILPTTESAHLGPCHNPWKLSHTPGGSSGGSAAAVAAGLVPIAHGNDGGGSIRIPASCCGLFGLKPTRSRTPLGPDYGDVMSGLGVEHVLTRSVRDSALLLDCTLGPDPGAPYFPPPPERPYCEEVQKDPGQLHIALLLEAPTQVPVHRDCKQAVEETAKLCEQLGHAVEPLELHFEAETLFQSFLTVYAAGTAWSIKAAAEATGKKATPEQFEPLTWALYEMSEQHTAGDYLLALQKIQKLAREVARTFETFDLLLTPVLAEPPLPLRSFASPKDSPLAGLMRAASFAPFTPIANITGQPAMSLPLFWNREGLPIGSHFVGRYGDEATLFRLAAQLESARPWSEKHPDLNAEASS